MNRSVSHLNRAEAPTSGMICADTSVKPLRDELPGSITPMYRSVLRLNHAEARRSGVIRADLSVKPLQNELIGAIVPIYRSPCRPDHVAGKDESAGAESSRAHH